LPAGDYFFVVDGYFDAKSGLASSGEFELDVAITPGGSCFADDFEGPLGNQSIDSAVDFAAATFDGDLQASICADDIDTFLIGHMGGPLTITGTAATGAEGTVATTISATTATITGEGEDTVVKYTAGEAFVSGTDAPRGVYLVQTSGAANPVTGTAYSLTIAHECQGDQGDHPLVAFDDETVGSEPLFDTTLDPIAHTLCKGDKDATNLVALDGGDLTVTLTGAGLTVSAVETPVPPDAPADDAAGEGEAEAAPAPVPATITVTTVDDVTTVKIVGAAAPSIFTVKVEAADPTASLEYTLAAELPAAAQEP
jgi:hypothetical protein